MKFGKFILLVTAVSFSLCFSLSCGHKKLTYAPPEITDSKDPKTAMKVWAGWVKPKGKKYDLLLNLQNDGSESLIIPVGSLQCFKGGLQGTFKHVYSEASIMDFRPGEKKSFNATCILGTKTSGDYKILIRQVYNNPTNDGTTRGDTAIAENVEWTGPETR